MQSSVAKSFASPWPHRWALALACATFPLLWIGGLVTTTDSGMAVADWPTTNGRFVFPFSQWINSPSDFFVEHGHRFYARCIGLLTIALAIVLWRCEPRRWVRWLGLAALALVILQGVLGGMRVLFNERTLAMLHGMTGPLFFAVAVAIAVFTSRRWHALGDSAGISSRDQSARSLAVIPRLALVTCILVYLQIAVGAVIRHVPLGTEPTTFALAVKFHLFLAAVLTVHIIALIWLIMRRANRVKPLAGLAAILGVLIAIQLVLGMATWIERFALPAWASDFMGHGNVVISDGGPAQMHIITTHVAVGSLLLATSLALALYSLRLLATTDAARQTAMDRMGAVV